MAFRSYGAEQGLGNLVITTLKQDALGFVWAATEDGVYRYDGQSFQRFGERDGLPSDQSSALEVDGDGTVWAGTLRGLARFRGSYFEAITEHAGLPAERVRLLAAVPRQNELWIGFNKQLFRQNQHAVSIEVPAPGSGSYSSLGAGPDASKLWAATWDTAAKQTHAQVVSFENGAWHNWELERAPDEEPIDALLEDKAQRIWARSRSNLWSLDAKSSMFRRERLALAPAVESARLTLTPQGELLLPSSQGLYRYKNATLSLLSESQGLPVPWVREAFEDRDGSLWVSGFGIARSLGRGQWRQHTRKEGLPGDVVWAVTRDGQGRLWVGTNNGLALGQADQWQGIAETREFAVHSISAARDQNLWLGSTSAVLKWDPARRRLERFAAAAGVPNGKVYRVLVDADNTLWGASRNGLFRADLNHPQVHFEQVQLPAGAEHEMVLSLWQGQAGRLWIAAEHGLVLHEHGNFRRFTQADGLLSNHVSHAVETRSGELLVSYVPLHGYSRFEWHAGRLKNARHPDRGSLISDQKIFALAEDSQGNIWAGTGRGVFVQAKDQAEQFTVLDGLPADDVNNMAFFEEANGDLWFGTSGGLAELRAPHINAEDDPPSVKFLDLSVGQTPLAAATTALPQTDIPSFSARFGALFFAAEHKLVYQARLSGVDLDWRTLQHPAVNYAALAPGMYHFEVRAQKSGGGFGKTSTFTFQILPLWYHSWLFYGIVGLGVTGALALTWRARSLRFARVSQALEQRLETRAHELHDKSRALDHAHDALRQQIVTDSLTGLKNRRYLGLSIDTDVARALRTHRDARLPSRRERVLENIDMIFLLVNIDHFRSINERHGHDTGDVVIRQAADILSQCVRETDTVVRYNGEEFLVILRNACRWEAQVLAERIRVAFTQQMFGLADTAPIHRTCSIGFAPFPFCPEYPDALSWEQTLGFVAQALQAAKSMGRDAWVGFIPPDDCGRAELTGTLLVPVETLLAAESPWVFSKRGLLNLASAPKELSDKRTRLPPQAAEFEDTSSF